MSQSMMREINIERIPQRGIKLFLELSMPFDNDQKISANARPRVSAIMKFTIEKAVAITMKISMSPSPMNLNIDTLVPLVRAR